MYCRRNAVSSNARMVLQLPIRLPGRWVHLKSTAARPSIASTVGPQHATPMSLHDMPGPTLFENLQKYRREGTTAQHLILQERFENYGPTFKLELPRKTWVCTCDPDNIEKVFRSEGFPAHRGVELALVSYYIEEMGLKGGIMGHDESWQWQRSAVGSKVLRSNTMKRFVPELCTVTDDTIASFKEGCNLDVLPDLMKWTTESIGVILFGHRIGVNAATPNKKALDFIDAVRNHFAAEAKLLLAIPFHRFFKTPTLRWLYGSFDKIVEITGYFVEKVREQRIPSLGPESVVQQLIEDGKLSHIEIVQLSVSMFSGGVDTTANSLLNLLYILSENPRAQQKLYEDIRRTLTKEERPTHKHLSDMPYLKAVIKESARLQPTLIGTSRKLKESIILSGYEVPSGTTIALINSASPSMNKAMFGENFEDFYPERWLRGLPTNIHPFASQRFGFGTRMCIGRRIAEVKMELFMIRLLQKYEIEGRQNDEEKMEWVFQLNQRPAKPFNLNLKKRK